MQDRTHKACARCGRVFRANLDGSLRRHWCEAVTGDSKTFALATGGTLTIQLSANWMLFGERERALLFLITDALSDYEQATKQPKADDPPMALASAEGREG